MTNRPKSIDDTPRIFIDDTLIATSSGVARRAHPCRKRPAPVLEPQEPWETQRVYIYGTVRYDPHSGRFRMWYMSRGVPPEKRDKRLTHSPADLVLYATSQDGVHWDRPDLGRYAYAGASANNIVFDLHSPSVILDEADRDPDRRYKMLGCHRGYRAATSPDGLRWEDVSADPILNHADTITLMRDPTAGEYLAFHKINAEHLGHRRRLVYLSVSRDFRAWSDPQQVMAPDEEDDAWVEHPDQRTEFYNMSAFPSNGQYLGLVTVFKNARQIPNPAPDQSPSDGPIDVQLVHSRDGRVWQRCQDRTPVIPNGPSAFDRGCILGVCNTPVVHGDETWVYYTAVNTTHGGAMPEKRITIGRAEWRRDGFVSLRAGNRAGVVETPALRLSGNRLIVNANASGGRLAIEALSENSAPIPGYTADNCIPLRADSLSHPVKWKAHDRLQINRPLRLRFHMKNTDLYAFSCTPA